MNNHYWQLFKDGSASICYDIRADAQWALEFFSEGWPDHNWELREVNYD